MRCELLGLTPGQAPRGQWRDTLRQAESRRGGGGGDGAGRRTGCGGRRGHLRNWRRRLSESRGELVVRERRAVDWFTVRQKHCF